jgi:hypothetical protein
MAINFITVPSKRLAASIDSSASQIELNDVEGWDGNDITTSDFGSEGYGVLRNEENTRLELFEFDPSNLPSTTIPINKRGLEFDGDLTTEVNDHKQNWVKSETIVELGSNPPQIFQWLKEYIDGIAVAGASDADNTTKGIVEIATDSEIQNSTSTGSTGAKLVIPADSPYVADQLERDVTSITSDATPSINTDDTDVFRITGLTTDITDMSANLSGSPDIWDTLVIEITGTATRQITWGSDFVGGGVYNLPTETDGTTTLKTMFNWNGSDWVLIGIA